MQNPLRVRIKAVKFDGNDVAVIKVEHQEFALNQFNPSGTNYLSKRKFVASNGFKLFSECFPQLVNSNNSLNVRGSDAARDNDMLLATSKTYIAKLKVAIREYNIHRLSLIVEPKGCSKGETIIE